VPPLRRSADNAWRGPRCGWTPAGEKSGIRQDWLPIWGVEMSPYIGEDTRARYTRCRTRAHRQRCPAPPPFDETKPNTNYSGFAPAPRSSVFRLRTPVPWPNEAKHQLFRFCPGPAAFGLPSSDPGPLAKRSQTPTIPVLPRPRGLRSSVFGPRSPAQTKPNTDYSDFAPAPRSSVFGLRSPVPGLRSSVFGPRAVTSPRRSGLTDSGRRSPGRPGGYSPPPAGCPGRPPCPGTCSGESARPSRGRRSGSRRS